MADDSLLSSLGRLAHDQRDRERTALGQAWDDLSANDLEPEALDAMHREAERDPTTRDAYEAFRPLGPAFEARMTTTVQRALADDDPASSPRPRPQSRARRAIASRVLGLAAALVAALGGAYLLGPRDTTTPLPAYTLEVTGGVATTRSTTDAPRPTAEPHRIGVGSRLRLVLRPATTVNGTVAAGLFLRTPSGGLRAWPHESSVEVDPQGAVLIESVVIDDRLAAWGEGPDGWWLLAVVGHAGTLPDQQQLQAGDGEDWQLLEVPIAFAPDRAPPPATLGERER